MSKNTKKGKKDDSGFVQLNEAVKEKNGHKSVAWDVVRDYFITKNIDFASKLVKSSDNPVVDVEKVLKDGYTFKDVSNHYGINYDYVRKQGSKGKWYDLLKVKIAAISDKALKNVEEKLEIEIEKVRSRHIAISRLLLAKGANHLESDETKLSNKDAINMVKLGADMERRALGVPDKLVVHTTNEYEGSFQSVSDHINSHMKKMELLNLVTDLIKQRKKLPQKIKDTEVIDV